MNLWPKASSKAGKPAESVSGWSPWLCFEIARCWIALDKRDDAAARTELRLDAGNGRGGALRQLFCVHDPGTTIAFMILSSLRA